MAYTVSVRNTFNRVADRVTFTRENGEVQEFLDVPMLAVIAFAVSAHRVSINEEPIDVTHWHKRADEEEPRY